MTMDGTSNTSAAELNKASLGWETREEHLLLKEQAGWLEILVSLIGRLNP